MSDRRTVSRPPRLKPCKCGGRLVEELANGITVKYWCALCDSADDEELAELIEGAQP